LGGESYQWERSCIQTWATSFRITPLALVCAKNANRMSELGATAQALGNRGTRSPDPDFAFSTIAGCFEGFIASSTTLLNARDAPTLGPASGTRLEPRTSDGS
jgi:hypothetical protein